MTTRASWRPTAVQAEFLADLEAAAKDNVAINNRIDISGQD
jgi:hypothetical protein